MIESVLLWGKYAKNVIKKITLQKCVEQDKRVHEIGTKDSYSYSDSDDSDVLFVGALDNDKNQGDNWSETIEIDNQSIHFQLNTGAKCNVINRADFK